MDEEKEKSSFLHFLRMGILLIGDIIIAPGAYSFSWYLRSVSDLGIFRGALSSDAFQRIPHHLWFIALTQVFFLYMAGLYTTEARPQVKRIVIRTSQTLFIQMLVLSVFYVLSRGLNGYPLSILPLFLVLNILFSVAWRILALRGILVLFFGIAKPKEFILAPEEEGMGAPEKCNLLFSEIKRLKEKKEEFEGKMKILSEKISVERDGTKLAKLLRLKRYCGGERAKVARTLVEVKLKVKNNIKPIKREKRRIEKKLGWLKKKVSMLELEKEIGEGLPVEEYSSQYRELGGKIENEEEEIKQFTETLNSYREKLLGVSSPTQYPSSVLSVAVRSKALLSSFFWLYFEYFFLIKLRLPYRVVEFFRKDLARLFIVAFMVLLISCAFLLILKKEKIAEEVANVAYFSLVIGVVIELILMIKQRKLAGHRMKDNARSRR